MNPTANHGKIVSSPLYVKYALIRAQFDISYFGHIESDLKASQNTEFRELGCSEII